MADRASSPHIEINFDTTLEDIIKATIFDDSPATPQPLTTSSQNDIDTSKAKTRFDKCPTSLVINQPTPEKSPDNIISSSNQNDIDTNKAETRFDECLASLISDQPTPEKSPDNIISSSSQNDIDTSKAETRFDECLTSLISDQPTPEKSPDNMSSSSQNDSDTSKAETRFDECLASLISDQPTPEKSPDKELHSDLQLALECLPPPVPQKIYSDNIISSNEIFSALQSIFRSEASSYTPSVLIKSVQPEMSTASRERQLLQRLDNLRPFHPQQMNDLTSFFKYQSAQVETDRYCALHQNSKQPHHIQESINQHYTTIHHRIMDRVESSLKFLEDNLPQQSSTINMTTTAQHQNNLRTRPSLSQKAVQLMEQWYYSHLDHPYPPSDVIQDLAVRGGIKEEQVKKWFSNKRNRSRRSSGINKRKMSSVNKCF